MNESAQQAHPFPRSVEALDEILAKAQAGKVASFAIITVDPNGIVGWKWHFGNRPQTDLIGGIECMKWTIVTNAMTPIMNPQPAQPDIPEPASEVRQ